MQKIGFNIAGLQLNSMKKVKKEVQLNNSNPLNYSSKQIYVGNQYNDMLIDLNKKPSIAIPEENFVVPEAWRVRDGAIFNNYGFRTYHKIAPNQSYESKDQYPKFNPETHKGLFLLKYKTGTKLERTPESNMLPGPVFVYGTCGYLYVDRFNNVTRIDVQTEEISPKAFVGTPAGEILDEFSKCDDATKVKAIASLIRGGRLNEVLKAATSKEVPLIQKAFKQLGLNENGKYDEIIEFNLEKEDKFAYQEKLGDIDVILQDKLANAEKEAEKYLRAGEDRAFEIVCSLGFSELSRAKDKKEFIKKYQQQAQQQAQQARRELSKEYLTYIDDMFSEQYSAQNESNDYQKLQAEKARLFNTIKSFFEIKTYKHSQTPQLALPRTIGLFGENCIMAQQFMQKVADKFGLKSDVVQYDTNHKNVIARLANSIYNANKRLEEKGEKTIIFLENIDDLMDERLSSEFEIARMKKLFAEISKDESITLMFNTQNIDDAAEKLDLKSETDYCVDLPADFNRANYRNKK